MTSATMRNMRRHRGTLGIVLLAFLASAVPDAVQELFPPSFWYQLRSVHIGSGPDFDKLAVTVDRQVSRDFHGTYRVRVWPEDMSAPTACQGWNTLDYHPVSKNPITKDTTWFIENQNPPCRTVLAPGRYVAMTCVDIHLQSPVLRAFLLPRVCNRSNVFELTKE